jgi:NADPH2:quinone reductase
LYVTRPTLGTYVVPRKRLEESAAEMFDLIGKGKLKVEIDQRYPLAEATRAHVDLEGRKTTGSSVLLP